MLKFGQNLSFPIFRSFVRACVSAVAVGARHPQNVGRSCLAPTKFEGFYVTGTLRAPFYVSVGAFIFFSFLTRALFVGVLNFYVSLHESSLQECRNRPGLASIFQIYNTIHLKCLTINYRSGLAKICSGVFT